MIFKQIPIGPMQNFSYIIADSNTKEAAVVDVGFEPQLIMEAAAEEKLTIKKIILTHRHFDHIQKINELALQTKSEVYFHEDDAIEIKRTIASNPIKIHVLKDKSKVKIGSLEIEIIHTPGHTDGSICLRLQNKLITGDTLFVGAIGRVDLPGGDARKLYKSLQEIKKLDDKIEVYPGHDYGDAPYSTIYNEKRQNPYLKCKTEKEFLAFLGY